MVVALVLLSAFLHAAWNAMLRLEQDKDRALVAAVGAATAIAIAVAGVRWALGEAPFAGAAAVGWALVAGALEVAYFVSLVRALEAGPLGPVYTISRGGAVLLVWPLSIAAFGELVTAPALAGSAILLAGLTLSSAGLPPARPAGPRRGGALAWAVACATAIAAYHLAYKAALAAGGSPSAVFAVALTVATAINAARLGAEGRRIAAAIACTRAPRVWLMGAVCGGSFLILMEALAAGGAGFVLTLRNTSVLFAVGLAWAIGDAPRRPQIAGAILVAAGAVLMAW
jgi:uncharacterized membrane protein